jgi:cysteine-rich repeat protein
MLDPTSLPRTSLSFFFAAPFRAALGVFLATVLFMPAPSTAQFAFVGSEFQVNTYTTSWQGSPTAAATADGGFVVVWGGKDGGSADGHFSGVIGQRFNASGGAVGTEFVVNTYTTYDQRGASVTAFNGGGFFVVWGGNSPGGNGIQGRRYDGAGAPVGSVLQLNDEAGGSNPRVAIAPDDTRVIVTWHNNIGGDPHDIVARAFDGSLLPLAAKFQVNSYTTGYQYRAKIGSVGGGGYLVTWLSPGGQDGDGNGVFGQLLDSAGALTGTEFQVNEYTTNNQQPGDIVPLVGGGMLVTFSQDRPTGRGVSGRLFDGSGNALAGQFEISVHADIEPAAIDLKDDGTIVTAWSSTAAANATGIKTRRLGPTGTPLDVEILVNAYTTGGQGNASVAALAGDRFVVVWANTQPQDGDSSGVFAQLVCDDVDADDTCDSDDGCPLDTNKTTPEVCGCGNPETDTDLDGSEDCIDICPLDVPPDDDDADGVCDSDDVCLGFDDNVDTDSDGNADGCDACPGFDDNIDTDTDGIADGCDACIGFDDNADVDADGVADGCDLCPLDAPPDDDDTDGVCDSDDACPGFDDTIDTDSDGIADGCDACPGFDDLLDGDGDGTANGCDDCAGFNDDIDTDVDGIPDGCDADALSSGQETDSCFTTTDLSVFIEPSGGGAPSFTANVSARVRISAAGHLVFDIDSFVSFSALDDPGISPSSGIGSPNGNAVQAGAWNLGLGVLLGNGPITAGDLDASGQYISYFDVGLGVAAVGDVFGTWSEVTCDPPPAVAGCAMLTGEVTVAEGTARVAAFFKVDSDGRMITDSFDPVTTAAVQSVDTPPFTSVFKYKRAGDPVDPMEPFSSYSTETTDAGFGFGDLSSFVGLSPNNALGLANGEDDISAVVFCNPLNPPAANPGVCNDVAGSSEFVFDQDRTFPVAIGNLSAVGNTIPASLVVGDCTADCRFADFNSVSACAGTFCGDNMLGAGEECDFGDTISGDGCDENCQVEDNASEIAVPIGGTVTTDGEDDGVDLDDPVESSVTLSVAGDVTISESTALGSITFGDGVETVGPSVTITAPAGTVADPITLVFEIHSSLLPDGETFETLGVFRNGVLLPECPVDGGGLPILTAGVVEECISARALQFPDTVELTVLTVQASLWSFGFACGDGAVNEGEECDDGNTNDSDVCSACRVRAEQSKAQDKCINALNKTAVKAANTQGKLAAGCVKNGGGQKLTGTVLDCIDSDPKLKLAKAVQKIADAETKSCAEQEPTFGRAPVSAIEAAAVAQAAGLTRDIFGGDIDASILTDKAGAKCQSAVAKAYEKIASTKRKLFLGCKKDGLKADTIDSSGVLETCFAAVDADEKGKAGKAVAKLAKSVTAKCVDPSVALSSFSGSCVGETTAGGFTACVDARVDCRLCLMFNDADSLMHDCDAFDDGVENGSCP